MQPAHFADDLDIRDVLFEARDSDGIGSPLNEEDDWLPGMSDGDFARPIPFKARP